jgi:hypothetical protein
MKKLEVFEPAMCCPTGICGPEVDPTLVRFSSDVSWLKGQGIAVLRSNLTQSPAAFVANSTVQKKLAEKGEKCLPLFIADGKVVREGSYPERQVLAAWFGLTPSGVSKSMTSGTMKGPSLKISRVIDDEGGCCGGSNQGRCC